MTLREYLGRHDIAVAAFARTLGVSVQALYRYINLERMPRRAECQRIADATGGEVTANDFYHAAHPPKAAQSQPSKAAVAQPSEAA